MGGPQQCSKGPHRAHCDQSNDAPATREAVCELAGGARKLPLQRRHVHCWRYAVLCAPRAVVCTSSSRVACAPALARRQQNGPGAVLGVGFGVLAGAYEMITPPIQLPDQPPPPKLPFKQVVRAAVRVQMQALRCRSVLIHCISSLAGAGGADERQPCQNAYQVALLEQEFCHRWRFVAVTATPAVSLSPAFIHRVYGCNSVVPPVLLLLQACSALWNAVWRATLGSTR